MKKQYVILTAPDKRTWDESRVQLTTAGVSGNPLPRLVVDELASSKACELCQRESTLAMAGVMPMKLIAPVEIKAVANPAPGSTWGVQAVGADTSPWTGDGITVAILDTGIDPNHAAFAGVEFVRRNFTHESDDDLDGHGTHCAGTIFGRAVDGVRIGVAPGVKKALIGKVIGRDGGGSDTIADAIMWAVSEGANVVSMSLGIDFPGQVQAMVQQGLPLEAATSLALEDYRNTVNLFTKITGSVLSQAYLGRPALLVAAAGNESRRNGSQGYTIAVSPPAAADDIISVAALGRDGDGYSVAYFSNTDVRIAAPGVDVISAKAGGGLTSMSGTSMATPHVAGVTALWAQKLSLTTNRAVQQLEDKVTGEAITAPIHGYTTFDLGNGLVQAPQGEL